MFSPGAAAPAPEISARARASRINGARSRGPKTEDGKARSSQNALKHGLRAERFVLLPDEDAAEFLAKEAALIEDLAPEGALEEILVRRIARATWRLSRADRIEAELFAQKRYGDGDLGLALIRDGNGACAFPTLFRYRGAAEAELWRALKALKALQAERAEMAAAAIGLVPTPRSKPARIAPDREAPRPTLHRDPIEPEGRRDPGESTAAPRADEPEMAKTALPSGFPAEPGRRGCHLGPIGAPAPEERPSSLPSSGPAPIREPRGSVGPSAPASAARQPSGAENPSARRPAAPAGGSSGQACA
jgi:hypothetical protein